MFIIVGAKFLPFFCKCHVNSYHFGPTIAKTRTCHRILFRNIWNVLGEDDCKTPVNVEISKQNKG
jgi:hypothetical protein